MDTHLPPEPPILHWRAPQRLHYQRSNLWYAVAGIFTLLVFTYALFEGMWDFAILTLVTAGMFWWAHKHEPSEYTFQVWTTGFAAGDEFVPWDDCSGFWFIKNASYTALRIERRHNLKGDIQLFTGPTSIHNIRTVLSAHLPELTDRKESSVDKLSRICQI